MIHPKTACDIELKRGFSRARLRYSIARRHVFPPSYKWLGHEDPKRRIWPWCKECRKAELAWIIKDGKCGILDEYPNPQEYVLPSWHL